MSQLTVTKDFFLKIANEVNSKKYQESMILYQPTTLLIEEFSNKYFSFILDRLHIDNFIVLDLSKIDNLDLNDLADWQEAFLGENMTEKNPQQLKYAKIAPSKEGKYYANSNKSQPLHTDEGYASVWPKYISLYCRYPARTGGITTIVNFTKLYQNLKEEYSHILDQLAYADAITIRGVDGVISKPILIKSDTDVCDSITYTAVLTELICSALIFEVYNYITSYIHKPQNQTRFRLTENQLLIINNEKILHGRTAFSHEEKRELYRFWFNKKTKFI